MLKEYIKVNWIGKLSDEMIIRIEAFKELLTYPDSAISETAKVIIETAKKRVIKQEQRESENAQHEPWDMIAFE